MGDKETKKGFIGATFLVNFLGGYRGGPTAPAHAHAPAHAPAHVPARRCACAYLYMHAGEWGKKSGIRKKIKKSWSNIWICQEKAVSL